MGTDSELAPRSPKAGQRVGKQSLADDLFTATQQRLLGLLFGQPERSYFVTELIDLADVGRGAVQRELARLERSQLVLIERHGNQKHYRANPDSPVYNELCSIVSKTIGIEENLRAALEPLAERMSLALIYGSVAKHSDTASSDIDLLVVSDELTLEELYASLADVEQQLSRKVNPTLYTADEFHKRRSVGNAFLDRVLSGPTIILEGQLDAA
jgi:predicted nucleotidyltransferase